MKDEKRIPRSYKLRASVYKKAMKRAKKEETTLAQIMEEVAIMYSEGKQLQATGYLFTSNIPSND